jgi:hypothetical protein
VQIHTRARDWQIMFDTAEQAAVLERAIRELQASLERCPSGTE